MEDVSAQYDGKTILVTGGAGARRESGGRARGNLCNTQCYKALTIGIRNHLIVENDDTATWRTEGGSEWNE